MQRARMQYTLFRLYLVNIDLPPVAKAKNWKLERVIHPLDAPCTLILSKNSTVFPNQHAVSTGKHYDAFTTEFPNCMNSGMETTEISL